LVNVFGRRRRECGYWEPERLRYLLGETTDKMQELTYVDRNRVHNLKYFTWLVRYAVIRLQFSLKR